MPQIREISAEDFNSVSASVDSLVEACDQHDAVSTLNEQTSLRLKHHGLARARLWVALAETGAPEERTIGFALLRGESLDVAVHPQHRAQGVGTELALASLKGLSRVEAWSHSDHPAAARLAARFGVPRARELKIMSRPTSLKLPEVSAPPGVEIRTFREGDLDALLRVNATAFAHHPEQGEMSAADFRERAGEPWFDPAGLFVALSGGELVGFHWTKVEGETGEVYVVAVTPSFSGRGLGKALTNTGLRFLAAGRAVEVILYVDGDNAPAIAVYEALGFRTKRTEAQYRGMVRG